MFYAGFLLLEFLDGASMVVAVVILGAICLLSAAGELGVMALSALVPWQSPTPKLPAGATVHLEVAGRGLTARQS
jgi:hypothetical protein